jgi:hypothetical protein
MAPDFGGLPVRLKISDCVRPCEGEVLLPRHERALLRLANPVDGVQWHDGSGYTSQ